MSMLMSREIVDPSSVGLVPRRLEMLVERAAIEVESGSLASCQIAVAKDGRLAAYEVFCDTQRDTRYILQSAARPVLASVMWKLIGDDLLDPDERVASIIP